MRINCKSVYNVVIRHSFKHTVLRNKIAKKEGEMTIQDIADRAQVSKATVSRVINGKPGVRDEIRDKVKAIIRDLGWKPSSGMWGSSRIPSGFIGMIVEGVSNPFYHDIIIGASDLLKDAGFNVVIFSSNNSPETRKKGLDYFLSGVVDGLIMIESDLLGREEIDKALKSLSCPMVLIEDDKKEISSVSIDNLQLGKKAGEYLASLGHKNIAHITGNYNFEVSRSRYLGFVQALMEAGLETDEKHLAYGDYSWESGYEGMKQLMSLPDRPTAVYTANDIMAYGAWQYADDNGIRIPEDVSLIGTDGLTLIYERTPKLTTICHPCREMGEKAAQLLLAKLRNSGDEGVQHVILDTYLREGGSCAPLNS